MHTHRILLTTISLAASLASSLAEKAAELPPMLAKPGKAVTEEAFDATALGKAWSVAKGEWQPRDGVLAGREKKEDKHAGVLTLGHPNRDSIIRFAYKMDGVRGFAMSLNSTKGGHLFRVNVTADSVALIKDKDKKDPASKSEQLGKAEVKSGDGKWHTLQLEIKGANVAVQTDHGAKISAGNPALDVEKTGYRFVVQGESLLVDDVKVWEAAK